MITTSVRLAPDVLLRPVEHADAAGFARAYQRSREHLRATEPDRGEAYYTLAGQVERLRAHLAERDAGRLMPWVLVHEGAADGAGEPSGEPDVVGAITL